MEVKISIAEYYSLSHYSSCPALAAVEEIVADQVMVDMATVELAMAVAVAQVVDISNN